MLAWGDRKHHMCHGPSTSYAVDGHPTFNRKSLECAYKPIQRWVDDHPGSPTHMLIMGRLDPIHRNDNLGLIPNKTIKKTANLIFPKSNPGTHPFYETSHNLWEIKSLMAD